MLVPLSMSMMFLLVVNGEPPRTFRDTDPRTGRSLECDRCPPGMYLQARCTETQRSVCAPCPDGSFTELWNYIGKCLRCGVCGHNQVVKTKCTAERDCQCECRKGFYYKTKYDMCLSHSECPTGHGVLSQGTAEEDTVCQICPNGTFSDTVSTHESCTRHKSCSGGDLALVLRGSTWHDSVCMSGGESAAKDGADYLREIIPSFFTHQKMPARRLRQILRKLPTENGRRHEGISNLQMPELLLRITAWVASAPAEQIRQLPTIVIKTGASNAGERLQHKLQRIDSQLAELRGLNNEVEADLMTE